MDSKKFFWKYSIVSDKDGNPWRLKVKAIPKLIILFITCFCIAFFLILALVYGNEKNNEPSVGILLTIILVALCGITSFVITFERSFELILTVRLNELICYANGRISNCYIHNLRATIKHSFYLPTTKVKYEGYTTTLIEGEEKKEVTLPYFPKKIDDALVKFLGEVGVTDLTRKKEEPS